MRRSPVAAFFASAAVVISLSFAGLARAAPPPNIGSQAPQFVLPVIANGRGWLSSSALRGHPIFLNFFASWCKPCQDEAKTLRELAGEFKRRGVVTVGIATLDTQSGAKNFVKQYGLPYPILFDASGSVGGSYGLAQLPLQVFISADGKVVLWGDKQMTEASGRDALRRLGLRD